LLIRALARSKVHVNRLFLVAAAAEADFAVNGLNRLLRGRQVDQVVLWCSSRDRALTLAKRSAWFMGPLAYGHMGLEGPSNIAADVAGRVQVDWFKCDHSQYFDNWLVFMAEVLRA
jgi:hypothetical protein